MKVWIRRVLWLSAIGATLFICHVSARLYQYSTYSLAFGYGPEPASFGQLLRYASYIEVPCSLDACINRLRQIDGGKQQWALEHGLNMTNDVVVTWRDIEPYIKHGPSGRLWCPRGGTYKIGKLSQSPTCSVRGHAVP